jgi:hypothetical protein
MATLLACQQTDIQSKNRLRSILSTGTGAFQMFDEVTSPEENLELMNTALPWSVSEELATSIFNRLSQSNNMTDTLYQFIPFGKTIYVIISEGFQEITENDKQYREFISNYMKACFSVATIQEVTCSSAMRVYIQTLHLG